MKIINTILICLAAFFSGLSLSIMSPFYPTEALEKAKMNKCQYFNKSEGFIIQVKIEKVPLPNMSDIMVIYSQGCHCLSDWSCSWISLHYNYHIYHDMWQVHSNSGSKKIFNPWILCCWLWKCCFWIFGEYWIGGHILGYVNPH